MLMKFARRGTVAGMRRAAQCLARIGIQTNPLITYPGQRSFEVPRLLKVRVGKS